MKNSIILTLLTTIFLVLQLQVNAQTTYVPDDNFEQTLIDLGHDSGPLDNFVATANISQLTSILLYNKNISDLTGIEDFTALEYLYSTENQLTSLDVSANVALKVLYCDYNLLTSLDVSANIRLEELYCDQNQLTSLDVSANTALVNLTFSLNKLTSLDVSANKALERLDCDQNQLTSLDVSANTALNILYCDQNQLTSLDVSANTALEYLFCGQNQLTSLDVSANTALNSFSCDQNQLTSLNIKNGNNNNFTYFLATSNSELSCITVDDANNVPSLFQNNVDTGVNFNEDCSTLSASEVEMSQVYIGPNPITNLLTIDLANTNTNLESAVLYDITGKIVLQTNKTTLVTTHLQSGLYILEVTTDKKILTKKLIKK